MCKYMFIINTLNEKNKLQRLKLLFLTKQFVGLTINTHLCCSNLIKIKNCIK